MEAEQQLEFQVPLTFGTSCAGRARSCTFDNALMDSTAYPHILERIIQQCCAVSTLLALRATSRRCRDVADGTLFYHAVLRREWHQPKPKGRLKKLLRRITAPELTAKRRFVMVLPASSHIVQDVPLLPFLPRKAEILDLAGARPGEPSTYDSIDRGRAAWSPQERERSTLSFGSYLNYAPLVLRRFGRSAQEDWGAVRDTTVDFIALPPAYESEADREYSLRIEVPLLTPRYVLYLRWGEGWDTMPRGGPLYFTGHWFGRQPEVRDVVLVLSLSRHCRPVRLERVVDIILHVEREFRSSASLTVVGLEGWLPGLTGAELKAGFIGQAVDPTLVPTVYDGIVFTTLEEWWESLGHMKDLVGVWPAS